MRPRGPCNHNWIPSGQTQTKKGTVVHYICTKCGARKDEMK